MSTTKTHITRIGTVLVPVIDQDRALRFFTETLGFETRIDGELGEGAPAMFTFREQDGNRYRVVERD
jgi:catechol 2,3-dioxygenase-like lactoylglutathione lyase family enzyme